MKPVAWDEEQFSGIAHTYRTWPASDIKGVYDRFDELLNYVKKSTAPRELSDDEILAVAVGELDCVDEEHIKRFARAILKKANEK